MSAQRSVALNILTGTRGALGVTALLTPRIGARMFRIDAHGPAIVMGRLFGIRNIALAAGLLRLEMTTVPRPFLLVNVLIDLVDAGAFMAGGRREQIGRPATVLGTALALTGAALSAAGFAALPAPQGGAHHLPDGAKAAAELGWAPIPLDEAVASTLKALA